jgi:VanZ family protein
MLAVAYGVMLVVMALIPSPPDLVGVAVSDWLVHGLAYGAQAVLVFWAGLPSVGVRRSMAAGVLGAALLGLATEALQWIQPARTAEIRDLVANLVGAVVACGIAGSIARFVRRESR